ncbi:MAG: phosphate signaling complex protein PhoU [Actinobacteria bacterium]|nr:phosphate signaling complex protein PhoU [Actinomycetota bacterium]
MAQARITFQEELRELEQLLDVEAELVLRSLRGAAEALVTGDAELADEVIAFDDDIDDVYLRTERAIELLLARQTPVASDLRLVLAILHSNLHLERMGDLCTTIAKLTKLSADLPADYVLLEAFREMGERGQEMIRIALDALHQRDAGLAESLLELDELIDRSNRRVVARLLELAPENLEWGLRAIVASRCLERIGDHAVDIGEQAAFLATGEFREFSDASHDTRPLV